MVTASAALDSIRICTDCRAPGDDQWAAGYAGSGAVCSRCDNYSEHINVYLPAANEPRLHMEAGMVGVEFSTCLDLEPWPVIVWDVNNYYRELGVDPRATKREIREAYQRLDGHSSPRLTHVVKQLLDDEVRALYDAVQPGCVFFDRYVAEYVRRQAAHDIAMSNMTGTSDGTPISLDLSHLMQKPFRVVDTGADDRQDAVSHPRRTTSAWGYYRWQAKSTDTHRLATWRGLVARALREKGVTQHIAVGFTGGTAPPVTAQRIGFRVVVFLDESITPNGAAAEAAASRVVSIIPTTQRDR